jgi:hypothetical protein
MPLAAVAQRRDPPDAMGIPGAYSRPMKDARVSQFDTDLTQATQAPGAIETGRWSGLLAGLRTFLLVVVGGAAGAFVGGAIGNALAPPPDPNAMLDLSALDYVMTGGVIGILVGAIGLPLIVSLISRGISARAES